jgi:flagellar motility protein MotE (MotC chaperone)
MAIPRAYQSVSPKKDFKIEESLSKPFFDLNTSYFGSLKFFYLFGLCIFLYLGLKLIDAVEQYDATSFSKNIENVKNIPLEYVKKSFAYASTDPSSTNNKDAKEGSNSPSNSSPSSDSKKNTDVPVQATTPQAEANPQKPANEIKAEESSEKKNTNQEEAFFDPLSITSSNEVNILKALGKEREKISIREKEINEKEKKLQILEKKIDEKIKTLTEIIQKIEEYLKIIDKNDNDKSKSMSQIYASMKPKDAANIFDKLDMTTILTIANQMSEKKLSAVLSALPPERAKEITEKLTKRGLLSSKEEKNDKTKG